jgi:hypothetical protein
MKTLNEIGIIQEALNLLGEEYRKSAKTLLRLPENDEIGMPLITLVKNTFGEIQVESVGKIQEDSVIARNPEPIGDEIFNEWVIPTETVKKNYGDIQLTEEFQPFQKIATVRAIPLSVVYPLLVAAKVEGVDVENQTFSFRVSWSDFPMVAGSGSYLTSGGYAISATDMQAYEKLNKE